MPDFFKLVHEWHVETKYGKWAPTQKEAFGSTWFLVSKWDRGWVKFVNDGKSLDLRKGKQGGECSSKFLDQLKVKRFEAASALMTEALSMMEDQDENQDPPTKKAKTDKHGKRHLKQALKDEAMRPQIVTMDMPPLKADDSHVQLSGVQMRVLTECMFEGKFWIELNSSNLMYLLTACRTSQSTRIEGEEKSKEEVADSDLASAQKGGAWRQSNDLEIIITSRIQALSSKELVWMPAGRFHASAVECTTAGFAAGIYAAVPYHQHHIVEGMWKIKTNCWHQFKLKTIRVFTNYYSTFTYICVYIYIFIYIQGDLWSVRLRNSPPCFYICSHFVGQGFGRGELCRLCSPWFHWNLMESPLCQSRPQWCIDVHVSCVHRCFHKNNQKHCFIFTGGRRWYVHRAGPSRSVCWGQVTLVCWCVGIYFFPYHMSCRPEDDLANSMVNGAVWHGTAKRNGGSRMHKVGYMLGLDDKLRVKCMEIMSWMDCQASHFGGTMPTPTCHQCEAKLLVMQISVSCNAGFVYVSDWQVGRSTMVSSGRNRHSVWKCRRGTLQAHVFCMYVCFAFNCSGASLRACWTGRYGKLPKRGHFWWQRPTSKTKTLSCTCSISRMKTPWRLKRRRRRSQRRRTCNKKTIVFVITLSSLPHACMTGSGCKTQKSGVEEGHATGLQGLFWRLCDVFRDAAWQHFGQEPPYPPPKRLVQNSKR